jgi:hypothetical protein
MDGRNQLASTNGFAGAGTGCDVKKNAICEAQWLTDILICRTVHNETCYAQAMVRLVACEKGQPIPPLNC